MSKAIIVIPCYNEAERLDVRQFREFSRGIGYPQFMFVNDGSTDGTREMLDALHRSDPDRFAVCDLPKNTGKGEAVRQGVLRAFESGPDYVGYWDADLATPLDAILNFSSVLDSRPDIEMVFGARVCLLGRSVRRKAPRHFLGRMFATAVSLALGIRIYDTQCGAKLFRTSSEMMSLFQYPFCTRWIFDVEILARLIATRRGTDRLRIEEVIYEFPLHKWHDVAGSKLKPGDFAMALFELAAISWKYRPKAKTACEPRGATALGVTLTHTKGIPAPVSLSRGRLGSGKTGHH